MERFTTVYLYFQHQHVGSQKWRTEQRHLATGPQDPSAAAAISSVLHATRKDRRAEVRLGMSWTIRDRPQYISISSIKPYIAYYRAPARLLWTTCPFLYYSDVARCCQTVKSQFSHIGNGFLCEDIERILQINSSHSQAIAQIGPTLVAFMQMCVYMRVCVCAFVACLGSRVWLSRLNTRHATHPRTKNRTIR